MRSIPTISVAFVALPLFASVSVHAADPASGALRTVPQIAAGPLIAAPNARQIVPLIGPASKTASVGGTAQKALAKAGGYLTGIASAVKQAVAVQATSPPANPGSLTPPTVAAVPPPAPSAAASVPPRLVRGPEPATRLAATAGQVSPSPVLLAGPLQVTRVAQSSAATKIAVYTCHLGEDYSLPLKKCVPEARPVPGVTAVAASTAGVTAVRTVARVSKTGGAKKSQLAGRIDGPAAGRMALGLKAKRK